MAKTVRDLLRVIGRFRPDRTSCRRTVILCWTMTKNVFRSKTAPIVPYLLRLTERWWRRLSIAAGRDVASNAAVADRVKCEVLYDPGPESTYMDVVFIHGLRGDKLKTWKQGVWKHADKQPEPVVVVRGSGLTATAVRRLDRLATDIKEFTDCWPRDWLPLDCPYVRVIAISYSTDPYLWRPIWLRTPAR